MEFVDTLWFSLFVKVASTATIVIAAAVAAEKSGPFWGGLVVGLPVSAGPAYVMLAIEYDTAFLELSSLNSLAGNTAAVIFLLVLAYIAPRLNTLTTLTVATAIWIAIAGVIRLIEWSLLPAIAINVVALGLTWWLTRDIPPGPPVRDEKQRRWLDLPVRAALIGLFVAGVVSVGDIIGPEATGIVSVYPVALTSLVLLIMPRLGGQTTAALMASIVRSMVGFAVGFLVIHLTVIDWGAALSLTAGLMVMIAWAALRLSHRALTTRRA